MATRDDDVIKLFQQVKTLESKVDKLTKLLEKLTKAEQDILQLGGIIADVIDDVGNLVDAVSEHNKVANNNRNIFTEIISALVND